MIVLSVLLMHANRVKKLHSAHKKGLRRDYPVIRFVTAKKHFQEQHHHLVSPIDTSESGCGKKNIHLANERHLLLRSPPIIGTNLLNA